MGDRGKDKRLLGIAGVQQHTEKKKILKINYRLGGNQDDKSVIYYIE